MMLTYLIIVFVYYLYFGFRFEPPDIDRQLCNEFAEKITLQLLSSSGGDSDSEDDNYYEWEAVSKKYFLLNYKIILTYFNNFFICNVLGT